MLAWSSLLLLLLPPGLTAMTCNSDGVLCVAYPSDCTSDCDYLLKYKAASADTTQIEVSGKPASHSLSASTSSNLWLAFGFSGTGFMQSGLDVYACQKYNNVYYVRKRKSDGYSLNSETEDVASGTIVGSLVDGVMTCKYTIDNSKLPSNDMKMAYGMGNLYGTGNDGMSKHSKTPRRSSNSFSIIQQYSASCSKPVIQDGTVSPDSETIDSGTLYTVTCGSGFTISGSATVTCTNGQLSALPECNSNTAAPCNKPTIEYGTVSPDSATIDSGTQYTVTCGSGFTISGSATVTCTNGQLSHLPECNAAASCNKPTIEHGTVSPDSAAITSGSQFAVECATGSGYTISGSTTVTCTDGVLSTLPTCSKDGEGTETDPTCKLSSGCYSDPANCTTSCSYSLRWSKSEEDTETAKVEVKLTGKPTEYSITDTSKMWIAFGFSEYGTMANSDIYLCLKNDEVYSTTKVNGYSHGITASDGIDLDGGTVEGSFNDGIFSCSYEIMSSHLSEDLQLMIYGMGPLDGEGNVKKHSGTLRTTTQKFSLLSDEIGSFSTIIASSITLLIGAVAVAVALYL